MKNIMMGLILATSTCLVQSAMATPIQVGSQLNTGGTLTGLNSTDGTLNNAQGLNFTAGGIDIGPGVLLGAAGTGTFNPVNCTTSVEQQCGTIQDIASFDNFSVSGNFLKIIMGKINFELDSPLTVTRAAATSHSLATLILSGKGILSAAGYDSSSAIFTLVTQGGMDTTYSASILATGAAPVPEPASMLLFGAALAGLMLTRRNKAKKV